jgi:hypothetical protein
MFDRSGSMTGDPIRYAKVALLNGLHMLGPEDKFTVVAFDHEQLWWTGEERMSYFVLACQNCTHTEAWVAGNYLLADTWQFLACLHLCTQLEVWTKCDSSTWLLCLANVAVAAAAAAARSAD